MDSIPWYPFCVGKTSSIKVYNDNNNNGNNYASNNRVNNSNNTKYSNNCNHVFVPDTSDHQLGFICLSLSQ